MDSGEERRVGVLKQLNILDSLPEEVFDDVVALASEICGTPIALISFVDEGRQWFKAKVGLDADETPREHAFCAHAILQPDQLMTVQDATRDSRFAGNPLVMGDPNIRFYAGAPIVTETGEALGTVCVIDTRPRELTPSQRRSLAALARQTAALLRLRELDAARRLHVQELSRKVTQALADDSAANTGLRQRQRLESVGQLVGSIVHDFNNLLHTVSMNLQMTQRAADRPDEVRRWTAGAQQALTRGTRLMKQLLAFSADRPDVPEVLEVDAVIAGMQDILRQAAGSGVALALHPGSGGARVSGNMAQLEAALLNMVINARDAMQRQGSVTVSTRLDEVRGDAELKDGRYLVLEVADNGPGMGPDVARRVFEPFFTTKGADNGTGLGLAQVFGFAVSVQGIARIDSAPGCGATFRLWLLTVA